MICHKSSRTASINIIEELLEELCPTFFQPASRQLYSGNSSQPDGEPVVSRVINCLHQLTNEVTIEV